MPHETVIRNGLKIIDIPSGSTSYNMIVSDNNGKLYKANSIDTYIGNINSILDAINGEIL